MRRAVQRGVVTGAMVAAVGLGVWRARPALVRLRRLVQKCTSALDRRRRYLAGKLEGRRYRRSGREPATDVPPDVLADRVRSALGPLRRRLDIPRVHVMVEGQTAVLHGEVGSEHEAAAIVEEVRQVAGVRAVRSHLAVGLTSGVTRSSEGHRPVPSAAHLQFVAAVRDIGVADPEHAVGAVLGTFVDRLPPGQRNQLLSHLPADVRHIARARSRRWRRERPLRTLADFDARVAAAAGLSPAQAETAVRQVLTTLHSLVPEEERDIAAVLPGELRQLWQETALRPA